MQLEIITLSGVSQEKKDKYCRYHLQVEHVNMTLSQPVCETDTGSWTQRTEQWL